MEETDLLKMAGFSTSGVAILLIVYRFLKTIIGKKIVSSCCGRRLDVGINVEEMTPKQPNEIVISNPIKKDNVKTNETSQSQN